MDGIFSSTKKEEKRRREIGGGGNRAYGDGRWSGGTSRGRASSTMPPKSTLIEKRLGTIRVSRSGRRRARKCFPRSIYDSVGS